MPTGCPLFRVIPAIILSACGLCMAAQAETGQNGNPEHSARAPSHIVSTRWLENGLRIVTMTNASDPLLVSIRLIVEGGSHSVPPQKLYLPHLVEHLAFDEPQGNRGVRSRVQRVGGMVTASTHPHSVVHEFDVPRGEADRTLRWIRSQWDRDCFTSERIQHEARRIRHELNALRPTPTITRLAHEFAPGTILDRICIAELATLDSLDVRDTCEFFRTTYVGARLTLAVVAPPGALPELEGAIQSFGTIPSGTPAAAPLLGDLSWLEGQLMMSDFLADNVLGLWFPLPTALSIAERALLSQASSTYLRDELALNETFAYDLDHASWTGRDAEIWLYEPYTDFVMHARPEVHAAAEKALRSLAEDSALGWWQDFLQGQAAQNSWLYLDSMTLSAELADLAELVPHLQPLPRNLVAPPRSAAAMLDAYRSVLESAHWFNVVPHLFRRSAYEFEEGPVLVEIGWLLDDWLTSSRWSFFAVSGLSLILLWMLTRIAIRDLARMSRGALSLWAPTGATPGFRTAAAHRRAEQHRPGGS